MAAVTVALNMLKDFLVAQAKEEMGLICNFKDDLEEMKSELDMIEAVLRDVERRSVQDKAVGVWYAELRDACYDIQDMLDPDLLQSRQLLPCDTTNPDSVWSLFLCKKCHPILDLVWFRNPFACLIRAHEMKAMRLKLKNIAERKNRYDLKKDMVLEWQSVNKERETCSATESLVLGRDEEVNEIVSLILENSAHKLFVIPIHGMGGLGKTTLAKLIYNDKRLREHFDSYAWAYVSAQFDLLNIGRRIIASFRSQACNLKTLQEINQELRKEVYGKRCFIVLDDVWEIDMDDHWRKLVPMLEGSSRGSVVLVTTRTRETAEKIATTYLYELGHLSEETCVELFQRRAFSSTDEMDEYPKLVDIGKKIVSKCGGEALAAIAFGSILRFERREQLWLHVKDSQIRELYADKVVSEKITMSSLQLSYDLMPSHLKLCFAYCSIFPKGYQIERYTLVRHWISLNFVRRTHQTDLPLECIAETYVNSLLSLSFLQECEKNDPSDKDMVIMHDLMHDLAQLVAKDHDIKVFTDEENTPSTNTMPCRYASVNGIWSPFECNELVQQSGKLRALYLHGNKMRFSDDSFWQLTSLRVLEVEEYNSCLPESIGKSKQLHYLSATSLKMPLPDSICSLQKLLYLRLKYCINLKKLPEDLGNLKSLKYLDLSYCRRLVALPESICKLQSLLHLVLDSCSGLKELPEGFGDLKSLQNLDLSMCYGLVSFPKSVSKLVNLERLVVELNHEIEELPEAELLIPLTRLKELSIPLSVSSSSSITMLNNLQTEDLNLDLLFTVKEEEEEGDTKHHCNIVALQHLNIVDGIVKLRIRGLERVKDPKDAEKANLKEIHKLQGLLLVWDKEGDELGDKDVAAAVFNALQPCSSKLNTLMVGGYRGSEWPMWMMDNHYKLQKLYLNRIEHIERLLQPLGRLQHLKFLELAYMDNMRKIDGELFRGNDVATFPSLERLFLVEMEKLEQVSLPMFPNLKEFTVDNCPRLISVRTQQPSSVTELNFTNIEHVATLPDWIGDFVNLKQLLIYKCPNIESLPNFIKQLPHLQRLTIDDCSEALKAQLASSFPSPSNVYINEDHVEVEVLID